MGCFRWSPSINEKPTPIKLLSVYAVKYGSMFSFSFVEKIKLDQSLYMYPPFPVNLGFIWLVLKSAEADLL